MRSVADRVNVARIKLKSKVIFLMVIVISRMQSKLVFHSEKMEYMRMKMDYLIIFEELLIFALYYSEEIRIYSGGVSN